MPCCDTTLRYPFDDDRRYYRSTADGGIEEISRDQYNSMNKTKIKTVKMKKQLFGFAILYHEPLAFDQALQEVRYETKILVPSQEILATGNKEAGHIAAMSIPAEYKDKMENVEVIVWKVNNVCY